MAALLLELSDWEAHRGDDNGDNGRWRGIRQACSCSRRNDTGGGLGKKLHGCFGFTSLASVVDEQVPWWPSTWRWWAVGNPRSEKDEIRRDP